jgi:protein tyrosine/serine phosphatase
MSRIAFHRRIWSILRYPTIALALAGLYLGGLQLYGNLHTLVPGEVYRSAQVDTDDIQHYQQKYGIRSIINLRGENIGKPWYDEEIAAAKSANITHINFRMAAKRELTVEQGKELIELMRNAPKPMLIHCKSGADRTGLAAALYMAAIENQPKHIAERELWPIYGHLPLPFLREYAMDITFDKMKPTLGYAK